MHSCEAGRERHGRGNPADDRRGDGQERASPDRFLVERTQRDVAGARGCSSVDGGLGQSPREGDEEPDPGTAANGDAPPLRAGFGERQAEEQRRAREGEPETMPRREPGPVQGLSE